MSQQAIEERLKRAAIRDRDLDRLIAQEWLPADLAEWSRLDKEEEQPRPLTPK